MHNWFGKALGRCAAEGFIKLLSGAGDWSIYQKRRILILRCMFREIRGLQDQQVDVPTRCYPVSAEFL